MLCKKKSKVYQASWISPLRSSTDLSTISSSITNGIHHGAILGTNLQSGPVPTRDVRAAKEILEGLSTRDVVQDRQVISVKSAAYIQARR
jgi:hypothetical protein